MRKGLARIAALTGAIVAAVVGQTTVSDAAEVRIRMRGGGFEVSGDLAAYDGAKYVINSPVFGNMTLDATRFECVGANCPSAPMVASFARSSRGPVGDLGTTNWQGGSGIGTDYMPQLVEAYAKSRGLQVERTLGQDQRDLQFKLTDASGRQVGQFNVLRRGVATGYTDLIAGSTDLVWTSARMTDQQAAQFIAAGVGEMRVPGREHVFALDSMVMLVSPDNPAVAISEEDIARIYSGQISDWSQLGLPAGKINVYAPVKGMGLLMHFENTMLKPRNLLMRDDVTRLGTVIEWSDKVAADPMGISFNFIGYVRNARPLNVETSCGLIAVPSTFATKTEEFPLARRLYFYTRGRPQSRLAQELLDFALSDEGQEVLRRANFVDQSPETLDFSEQGARIAYALNAPSEDFDFNMMRQLISDITPSRRLTTTFRFETASFTLDTKARSDIDRLRQELSKPEYRGKSVMLLGYADSVGQFPANDRLALRRAQAVQQTLAQGGALPVNLEVKSYSELAPVACNDTPEGRSFNRRVEVWIR